MGDEQDQMIDEAFVRAFAESSGALVTSMQQWWDLASSVYRGALVAEMIDLEAGRHTPSSDVVKILVALASVKVIEYARADLLRQEVKREVGHGG